MPTQTPVCPFGCAACLGFHHGSPLLESFLRQGSFDLLQGPSLLSGWFLRPVQLRFLAGAEVSGTPTRAGSGAWDGSPCEESSRAQKPFPLWIKQDTCCWAWETTSQPHRKPLLFQGLQGPLICEAKDPCPAAQR